MWILGARDPEMTRIEEVLFEQEIEYKWARRGRRPVNADTAYRANIPPDALVCVECGPAPEGAVIIDHHRPGDPGYGVAPEEYLAGSSLGQTLRALGVEPEPDDLIIAAADHCLRAAYQGRCPGVEPDAVRTYRARQRARYLRGLSRGAPARAAVAAYLRPGPGSQDAWVAALIECQAATASALRELPEVELGGHPVRDARADVLPELPEVSAVEGIDVVYAVGVRRGVFGEAEIVAAWMAAAEQGQVLGESVVGVYGDPVRGYAGARLAPP